MLTPTLVPMRQKNVNLIKYQAQTDLLVKKLQHAPPAQRFVLKINCHALNVQLGKRLTPKTLSVRRLRHVVLQIRSLGMQKIATSA